ncbi:MAG: hypothetical protein ACLP9S_01430 [Syntrophales bacterium]|jgi:hypothetical protein
MKKYVLFALLLIFMNSFSSPCHALTPDQIIKLKKAGVSDKTIQMMLEQERDAKQENPSDAIGVREVKDKDGNIVTVYSTGRPTKESPGDTEEAKVENAWKMLQNMVIDNRNRK